MSFKQNVSAFWDWFEANEKKIAEAIIAKTHQDLVGELSRELDKVFGEGSAFLVGGGEGNFELVAAPEGSRGKLFLTRFWKDQVPQIPGWTFLNLKPPAGKSSPDFAIQFDVNGQKLSLSWNDIYILPDPNKKTKKIDIKIYSEKLLEADEQTWGYCVFISLDNCLGEAYVETAIGAVEPINKKSRKMIPLTALYSYVTETFKKKDWQLFDNPDEIYSAYSLEPKEEIHGFREDIFTGVTLNVNLIESYLSADAAGMEYMRQIGAEYAFLVYDHRNIEQSEILNCRYAVQEALDEYFDKSKTGRILGGATGIYNSYIDLIIFDINEFNTCLDNVLGSFDVQVKYIPFLDILSNYRTEAKV